MTFYPILYTLSTIQAITVYRTFLTVFSESQSPKVKVILLHCSSSPLRRLPSFAIIANRDAFRGFNSTLEICYLICILREGAICRHYPSLCPLPLFPYPSKTSFLGARQRKLGLAKCGLSILVMQESLVSDLELVADIPVVVFLTS